VHQSIQQFRRASDYDKGGRLVCVAYAIPGTPQSLRGSHLIESAITAEQIGTDSALEQAGFELAVPPSFSLPRPAYIKPENRDHRVTLRTAG
jgi:hypothetical protein